MEIIPMLLKEMDQEAITTRKMLALVPEDKFEWQPHVKSMKMMSLATHLAELPAWVSMVLTTDELDFAKNEYKPTMVSTAAELGEIFEKSLAEGRAELAATNETVLANPWTLRIGDHILMTSSKAENVRHAYCQMVHHRAQLGVYLRLLDIPIPGSYGPSADEK